MSRAEFFFLCHKYLVAPGVALENKHVTEALAARDDARVEEVLKTEF